MAVPLCGTADGILPRRRMRFEWRMRNEEWGIGNRWLCRSVDERMGDLIRRNMRMPQHAALRLSKL